MLAHSFLIESSSELLVTRAGVKARTSSISGIWFPGPIYMFFETRFDLGTLDSGERLLPFGLLVHYFSIKTCGFSLESHRFTEAIVMCTHNIYFYGGL